MGECVPSLEKSGGWRPLRPGLTTSLHCTQKTRLLVITFVQIYSDDPHVPPPPDLLRFVQLNRTPCSVIIVRVSYRFGVDVTPA